MNRLEQTLEVKTRKQIRTEDFVETCSVLKTLARVASPHTPHTQLTAALSRRSECCECCLSLRQVRVSEESVHNLPNNFVAFDYTLCFGSEIRGRRTLRSEVMAPMVFMDSS